MYEQLTPTESWVKRTDPGKALDIFRAPLIGVTGSIAALTKRIGYAV